MTRFEIEGHTTRLISNSVMLGECLYDGRFIAYQRSVSGRPCYQGDTDPMHVDFVKGMCGKYPIESFELEIDGKSLHGGWQWADARDVGDGSCAHGVVVLTNALVPVTVSVHSRLDGTAFIERWLEITNTGRSPICMSKISPMSGLLWRVTDKREFELPVQFEAGLLPYADWGYEGYFEWRDLKPGITAVENYAGRSGWGVPWFCARNCASGEVFVGHLEWSANWQIGFNRIDNPGAKETSLLFYAGPKARAPQRVIEPGETVASPIMHLGHMHGAADHWVQETHRHIRNVSVGVTRENLYIGAARIVDGEMDWLEKEVKLAADMGMEYFLVDAGWYGNYTANWYNSTGDWNVSRFGGDMTGVRELIHSYGMRFGLWMEPESAGKDSELHKQRPEWSLQRDGHSADAHGRVLDLSKPEAFEYVQKSIFELFDIHNVDFFKIDYNTADVNEHGENIRSGVMENAAYRYTQALYAIYDKIKAERPDIYLENCAGGGGRNDLGLFRRCHVSCLSDYAVFPRSIKALNNMSMALPPERLRFYYRHYPGYHMYGDIETQLRVLMFCVPLFVGFGRDDTWVNEEENKIVRKYIELYKNFCRPILQDAKIYHHTPGLAYSNTEPWCVLEYENGGCGYAGIFRLLDGSGSYAFIPRGVRISQAYKVTFMNKSDSVIMSGITLATTGLPVVLDGALSSELILYEAQGLITAC